MVLQSDRGSWAVFDWNSDCTKLLVRQWISATSHLLFVLDIADGSLTSIECGDERQEVAIQSALFHKNGRGIFVTSTRDSEFASLRYVPEYSQIEHQHVTTASIPWDIEHLCLSGNGKTLAFVANENATGKVYCMDTSSFSFFAVDLGGMPAGVISQLAFSPEGTELGFKLDSTISPGNVYTVTIEERPTVRQWTFSENQLDVDACTFPESFHYDSFDGKAIPAFIYQPQISSKEPQPVVIYIHGEPAHLYSLYQCYYHTLTTTFCVV